MLACARSLQPIALTSRLLSAVSSVLAPAAVYWVQGILGLARLAVTFLFKDEFMLQPATVRALLCGQVCVICRSSLHMFCVCKIRQLVLAQSASRIASQAEAYACRWLC